MGNTTVAAQAEIARPGSAPAPAADACELCHRPGGEVLWQDDHCRVVAVADADYPGFCRVILSRHVREMSDLPGDAQNALMRVVFAVEAAVRQLYRPDKINLASFGNVVPHVHWHVIPRWHDDRHFPQPIWGTPQRTASAPRTTVSAPDLAGEIARRLEDAAACGGHDERQPTAAAD